MTYTELQVTSNFSFLRGASHPFELVQQAVANGQKAIAITDHNSFAGIVRGHSEAKRLSIRLIPAVRLNLLDGPGLLAYPIDKDAYARLSNLLTLGNSRTEKGDCHLYKADVYQHSKDIKFLVLPPDQLNPLFDFEPDFIKSIRDYREAFGSNTYLAASRQYRKQDAKWLFQLQELSETYNAPMVATNNVYYHHPARREIQDVLTCVREKCTIQNAGYRLYPNAERQMKSTEEMIRLFRQYPDAIRRTQEITEACQFSLNSLAYVYPEELTTEGRTTDEHLAWLTWEGARQHFPNGIPQEEIDGIGFELAFVKERCLASYFLTVEDIVREARRRKILCQGRGSAANSRICYYTGITAVDPSKHSLLFARFMSEARDEPPDIDIDFEHERREEIMQYVYEKYGRDRSAIVATVTRLRKKGALRDVGRAMGLSVDRVDLLSKDIESHPDAWFHSNHSSNPDLIADTRSIYKIFELIGQVLGFPRQLGQHTGGFVITAGQLSDLCPIFNARMENRTCIEWDKDDIDDMGFIKVDILALGILSAIRKAFDLIQKHHGRELTLQNIPQDDPAVYEMITEADTVGLFQIESRAQQAMLPRMRPSCFYDLVIQISLVRPGPIVGHMVQPYLARRNEEEKIEYPSKTIEKILGRTLGIMIFQEQGMQIAIEAAGFNAADADALRRTMGKRNEASPGREAILREFATKFVDGMTRNGYTEDFARLTFGQISAFSAYGFPESHSTGQAIIAYTSAWLRKYYHAVFVISILNSLPMGFYAEDQLLRDALLHGVKFLPVDVNYSQYDYTLEEGPDNDLVARIGFRQITGIREADMLRLIACRVIPYTTVHSLLDANLSISTLERLANADAFGSLGLDRRKALWEVSALADRPIGLFADQPSESAEEDDSVIPVMTAAEDVAFDYVAMSLSLKGHPLEFLRPNLRQLNNRAANELPSRQNGEHIFVAGLLRMRQRPETAHGTCFILLEDETGSINLIVWAKVFDEYRKEICSSKILMVEGHLQIQGPVIHVIVQRCWDMTWLLGRLISIPDDKKPVTSPADPAGRPGTTNRQVRDREMKQASLFPKARNFK
ncbi:MAG TPA: error-prone DNA polymerase [Puia sp.]|jgi:error-prone DNA polymerase